MISKSKQCLPADSQRRSHKIDDFQRDCLDTKTATTTAKQEVFLVSQKARNESVNQMRVSMRLRCVVRYSSSTEHRGASFGAVISPFHHCGV